VNTDSSVNVIVFEVLIGSRLERLLGEGPTRIADGICRVWEDLAQTFGVSPEGVRRVYSQWEATEEDKTYIAATFPPSVELAFSFRRPCPGQWGDCTAEFARVVEEFEKLRFGTEVKQGEQGNRNARRPWWQYWD
jgi:hypothetical protein